MAMPNGRAFIEYNEVCMVISCYGKQLAEDSMSYSKLIETLDRLTSLRDQAKKLWGDQ